MRKMKLDLSSLEVEAFDVQPRGVVPRMGTIRAHATDIFNQQCVKIFPVTSTTNPGDTQEGTCAMDGCSISNGCPTGYCGTITTGYRPDAPDCAP